MYEAFFGLRQRPFTPAPQINRYFPAETIEPTRGTVARCLSRAEGVAVVVGPSGTGKTLLCQMLRAKLQPEASVATLCCGRLTSIMSLYQTILFELGRPYRGANESELRLDLVDYLTDRTVEQRRLILLVDEAHTLPLKLLEEIRMMTNLANSEGEPHVRVLLAGSHVLEERFTHPKLEAFSQRITTRCYLEPFRQDETRQYIHAQIDAVGGNGPKLFSTKATKAVFQATDGIPRLVNQVCDHALLLAAQEKKSHIDDREIEIAWADLQQLPTPWNDEPADSASVVEFGTLDEAPCCTSHAASHSGTVSHKDTTTDDLLADLVASSDEPSCFEEAPEDGPLVVLELDDSEPEETVESILSDLINEPEEIAEVVILDEPATSSPPAPSSSATENPFRETFESEEKVHQPLGTNVGRSPMIVPVDSPLLTYTPRESVDIAYSHAPPLVREKLTLFTPDEESGDTVSAHLTRLFASLRRA